MDALLSTVQMPKGIPVATVAIGSAGAVNSAYLAAQILGVESEDIRNSLLQVRAEGKEAIKESNKKLYKLLIQTQMYKSKCNSDCAKRRRDCCIPNRRSLGNGVCDPSNEEALKKFN